MLSKYTFVLYIIFFFLVELTSGLADKNLLAFTQKDVLNRTDLRECKSFFASDYLFKKVSRKINGSRQLPKIGSSSADTEDEVSMLDLLKNERETLLTLKRSLLPLLKTTKLMLETPSASTFEKKLGFLPYILTYYQIYTDDPQLKERLIDVVEVFVKEVTATSIFGVRKQKILESEKKLDKVLEEFGINNLEDMSKLLQKHESAPEHSYNSTTLYILDNLISMYQYSLKKTDKKTDIIMSMYPHLFEWISQISAGLMFYTFLEGLKLHNPYLLTKEGIDLSKRIVLLDRLGTETSEINYNIINSFTPKEFIQFLNATMYAPEILFLLPGSNYSMKLDSQLGNWGVVLLTDYNFVKSISKNIYSKNNSTDTDTDTNAITDSDSDSSTGTDSNSETNTNVNIDINEKLDFLELYSYFQNHGQDIYFDLVSYISKSINPNFSINFDPNLITLLESLYSWVLLIHQTDNLSEQTIKTQVQKMLLPLAAKFLELDDNCRLYFLWAMKYRANNYIFTNDQNALNVMEAISSALCSYLLIHSDLLTQEQIKTILDITLPNPKMKDSFSLLFSYLDCSQKNFVYLIHTMISNHFYDPFLKNLTAFLQKPDFDLSDFLKTLDLLSKSSHRSMIIFLQSIAKNINHPKDLGLVLNSLKDTNFLPIFLEEFSSSNFIKENPFLTPDVSEMLENISFVFDLPKEQKLYLKSFLSFYLLQKDKLNQAQIDFILTRSQNQDLGFERINQAIKGLSSKEAIDILSTHIWYLEKNYQDLVPTILSWTVSSFEPIEDSKLYPLISIIISELKPGIDTSKINMILSSKRQILDMLIKDSSGPMRTDSQLAIKKYLIDHSFIEKEVKEKRQIKPKKVTVEKKKEKIILEITQTTIQNLKKSYSNPAYVKQFIETFEYLIDLEYSYSKNKGKKLYQDISISLDLFLDFFEQNVVTNSDLHQVIFPRLTDKIWNYVLNSSSIDAYELIDNYLSTTGTTSSSLTLITDLIENYYNQAQFKDDKTYSLIIKLLNHPDGKLTLPTTRRLMDLLTSILKADNTLINDDTSGFKTLKFFNPTRITKELIPLIIKYWSQSIGLYFCMYNKLKLYTPNHGLDENGLYILRLNKIFLDSIQLDDLSFDTKLILASFLDGYAYLYMKNNVFFLDKISSFIKKGKDLDLDGMRLDLFDSLQAKIDVMPDLRDEIAKMYYKVDSLKDYSSEESKLLREKTSILIILLAEIEKSRLVIDLSGQNFFKIGYDIISSTQTDTYFIEAKSKMSLFSKEYPLRISYNEGAKALDFYTMSDNLHYKIYVVPLKPEEIARHGQIIDFEIDYNKLDNILQSINQEENPSILLDDIIDDVFKDEIFNPLYTRSIR